MRGKRALFFHPTNKDGLIPAHAGKTQDFFLTLHNLRAHPRACGENTFVAWFGTMHGGSSPRMRGKLVNRHVAVQHDGLIPAHAGKTSWSRIRRPRLPAHPRACGENMISTKGTAKSEGSSPRMRGKPNEGIRGIAESGLIPAHAGKTGRLPENAYTWWAHPRACGENLSRDDSLKSPAGSSPRMRGKRAQERREFLELGLIPAHAGKTWPV